MTPFGSRSTAPRRDDGFSVRRVLDDRRRASTPSSSATAVAASTFIRWPRPSSGIVSVAPRRPASTSVARDAVEAEILDVDGAHVRALATCRT